MIKSQVLLLAAVALSLFGTGQVWLVQVSSYRLWTYVGPKQLPAYHLAWWRSIWGVVLGPAGLLVVIAVAMVWCRAPGVPAGAAYAGLALQGALVAGTVLWWGPLMARLVAPDGTLPTERYRLLMTTHWLRVGIVTGYALLALWMLVQDLRVFAWHA